MLGRDDEPTVDWRAVHQSKVYLMKASTDCLHIISKNVLLTQHSLKIDYATIVIEKVTYTCIKLSVLFFYRRIFAQRKSFRIANDVLIVLITLWGLIFFLMQVVLESNHGHIIHPGDSQEWLLLWFGITDVLGDIAVLTLPYPCIRRLQMNTKSKVWLTVIFLLGTL